MCIVTTRTIQLVAALTNVCVYESFSPAEPTLTVIVGPWCIKPSAFADTNV